MNEGLFFRRADGAEIPVKEVEGLKGDGLLILMTETFLREEDLISRMLCTNTAGSNIAR